MNQDSPLDQMVKQPLIADLFNLIGVRPYKRKKKKSMNKTGASNFTEPKKKRRYTSYEDLKNMNEKNFKEILNPEDYVVLFETDEEYCRRGNFVRVFPTSKGIMRWGNMFDVEKSNNMLVWKWLRMKENGFNILDYISDCVDFRN